MRLRKRIEDAIEGACGFRSGCHFAHALRPETGRLPGIRSRRGPSMEPVRSPSTFWRRIRSPRRWSRCERWTPRPEELHIDGRELYIYYANGMARPKLSLPQLEKTLRTSGTSRNLNTVRKLLEMAEKLEAPGR